MGSHIGTDGLAARFLLAFQKNFHLERQSVGSPGPVLQGSQLFNASRNRS